MVAHFKRRNRLKSKIAIYNGLNSLAAGNERKMNEVMNEAERRNAYIPGEAYEKQQQAQSNKEATEDKLFDLKEELEEVENEIEELKSILFNECQKTYDKMCNYSGIENYISEMISSDSKIKEYLVTILDMAEIFWFGNRAIYIPHNVAEETRKQQAEEERRREEQKREEENRQQSDEDEENCSEEIERKWFSAEAYQNKDILSKEYHKLVSQYHPDNNPSPDAVKKFLSIKEEREKILEILEK